MDQHLNQILFTDINRRSEIKSFNNTQLNNIKKIKANNALTTAEKEDKISQIQLDIRINIKDTHNHSLVLETFSFDTTNNDLNKEASAIMQNDVILKTKIEHKLAIMAEKFTTSEKKYIQNVFYKALNNIEEKYSKQLKESFPEYYVNDILIIQNHKKYLLISLNDYIPKLLQANNSELNKILTAMHQALDVIYQDRIAAYNQSDIFLPERQEMHTKTQNQKPKEQMSAMPLQNYTEERWGKFLQDVQNKYYEYTMSIDEDYIDVIKKNGIDYYDKPESLTLTSFEFRLKKYLNQNIDNKDIYTAVKHNDKLLQKLAETEILIQEYQLQYMKEFDIIKKMENIFKTHIKTLDMETINMQELNALIDKNTAELNPTYNISNLDEVISNKESLLDIMLQNSLEELLLPHAPRINAIEDFVQTLKKFLCCTNISTIHISKIQDNQYSITAPDSVIDFITKTIPSPHNILGNGQTINLTTRQIEQLVPHTAKDIKYQALKKEITLLQTRKIIFTLIKYRCEEGLPCGNMNTLYSQINQKIDTIKEAYGKIIMEKTVNMSTPIYGVEAQFFEPPKVSDNHILPTQSNNKPIYPTTQIATMQTFPRNIETNPQKITSELLHSFMSTLQAAKYNYNNK